MYLTRAFLNAASADVRADLRSPESLHKTVMRAFPDGAGPSARASHGVLHRLDHERDGRLVLLIQSITEPTPSRWPSGYALELGTDFDVAFSNVGTNPAVRTFSLDERVAPAGSRFAFRLRANTTRKIDTKSGSDGARRNGRRVPVRGDDQRIAWLVRRAAAAGFVVDEGALHVLEVAPNGGRGAKGVTLAGAIFDGLLMVEDSERFCRAVREGIGPGKAYGFGLLSLRPLS